MIPIPEKTQDVLHVSGALLWIFLVVVSWTGYPVLAYAGLLATALLGVLYFILGTTVKGKTGIVVPLIYPCLTMTVFWIIAFTAAYSTRGRSTETWIVGLHPGQFWTLLFFWIGTFLTSTLSYALYFDTYIFPEGEWESFLEKVNKMKMKKDNNNE